MATVKLFRSGLGTAGTRSDASASSLGPSGKPRGICKGWSVKASMRNERFLQSVIFDQIDAYPILSVTLSVKLAPATPEEWKRIIDVFLKWLKREGFTLYHWVTEWAMRSRYKDGSPVPHLHMIIFNTFGTFVGSDDFLVEHSILMKWLSLTAHLESGLKGQHVVPVNDLLGWAKYVAKHSARSNRNAQRQEVLPDGWDKPGRMWGASRNFPLMSDEITVADETHHVFRRLILRYLVSQEAKKLLIVNDMVKRRFIKRRIKYLRGYLQKSYEVSPWLGVAQWVPREVSEPLLVFAIDKTREILERFSTEKNQTEM